MIDQTIAATEIRRLSRLKGYPRSWESAGEAAAEQDAQAEAALIEAAAAAPSEAKLRQWVNEWERRHVESPVPANLYEAWRGPAVGTFSASRRQKCKACGDSGYITRHFVAACIGDSRAERIYIGSAEVEDWWARIRATPTCAQRVYDEAYPCGCSGVAPHIPLDTEADAVAYRDFAARAAGDAE